MWQNHQVRQTNRSIMKLLSSRLTLDLNVHHHYPYPEQQPLQVQHYPRGGGYRGAYNKPNTHQVTLNC